MLKYLFIFFIGTILGSFLNCLSDRYLYKEYKGRSSCDNCKHILSFLDLIPIFSFLFLKGRCKYCGHIINKSYLISELVLGIIFVLAYKKIDLFFITILYGLSLCDIKYYEIPDYYIVLGLIYYFINNGFTNFISSFLIALFVLLISLLMNKIYKKECLGGGDIKLLLLVNLYLKGILGVYNLFISCLLALIFILIFKKDKIYFGPFISVSTIICLFCHTILL